MPIRDIKKRARELNVHWLIRRVSLTNNVKNAVPPGVQVAEQRGVPETPVLNSGCRWRERDTLQRTDNKQVREEANQPHRTHIENGVIE